MSKVLAILGPKFQKYYLEQRRDPRVGMHYIFHGLPTNVDVGCNLVKLQFFLEQKEFFSKLFGLLSEHSDENEENGLILRKPLGLKAITQMLEISVDEFIHHVLTKFNFVSHEDNPKTFTIPENERQDYIFYHPQVFPGANAYYTALTNVPRHVNGSYSLLPMLRRNKISDKVRFQQLVEDIISNFENAVEKYKAVLIALKHLRELRDLEKVKNCLSAIKNSQKAISPYHRVMPLLLHGTGLALAISGKKKDVVVQKLAERLLDGDDFVQYNDVLIKSSKTVITEGDTRYRQAIDNHARDYAQAKQLSTGKQNACKRIREAVIDSVKSKRGRFLRDDKSGMKVLSDEEMHKIVGNRYCR